ncbi:MAG: DHH family phosphoesterase [Gracilimonas sp.]|nr:DHH family phosphoesterase [Gracilimonas sp.]
MRAHLIAVMWGKEYATCGIRVNWRRTVLLSMVQKVKTTMQAPRTSYSAANDVVIGEPNPGICRWALPTTSTAGNFDLGVLVQFVSGPDIYNGGGRYQAANSPFFGCGPDT